MASYNRVILMGNLTRDPQGGTLPNSGTAVCEFGLAVNRTWKDADGNAREEVLFIDCTAFGKPAETLGKYLHKGRPVHVEGRLKLDRWEQEGQPRSKIRVIVEQFRFVDSAKSQAADAGAPGNADRRARDADNPDMRNIEMRPPKRRGRRYPRAAAAADASGPEGSGASPPGKDDDIPF